MKFEVPTDIPPITEAEKMMVHQSLEIHEGFVYFHRVSSPTPATVIYSSAYIIQRLNEAKTSRLILDFTDRDLVNHRLRRLMLRQASEIMSSITNVVFVLDGNTFRRVLIEFFTSAYFRHQRVTVNFCMNKSEAFDLLGSINSKTQ